MKMLILSLILMIAVTGCSTLRDSLLLGGGIGLVTGGVVGSLIRPNIRSAALGAVVGAAFGTLMGFGAHEDEQKKRLQRSAPPASVEGKPRYPKVSTPEVRAIWIPEKIENDEYVSGHYIYVIDKPATFRKEEP